ncbi:uncharacterized protein FA14DRAFT_177843 [Meira miltonrushii]|uniref:Uncharacterized protein n=1 Tax=Meira miltonrushii TaxID=1280837 RepID=A0A316VMP5_9BASI|nr:uncharacterized protein FA14DRAFT_177843 [Meira miltonrushii]PWN38580.1 hypothetical protein FA14DRAFT_177843 [Meira miltonrushii]
MHIRLVVFLLFYLFTTSALGSTSTASSSRTKSDVAVSASAEEASSPGITSGSIKDPQFYQQAEPVKDKKRQAHLRKMAYQREWRALNPEKVKAAEERFKVKYNKDHVRKERKRLYLIEYRRRNRAERIEKARRKIEDDVSQNTKGSNTSNRNADQPANKRKSLPINDLKIAKKEKIPGHGHQSLGDHITQGSVNIHAQAKKSEGETPRNEPEVQSSRNIIRIRLPPRKDQNKEEKRFNKSGFL